MTQTFGLSGDPRRVMALESASLSVARGELVSLIGPSGCGKSTLLNIMGGLDPAQHGPGLDRWRARAAPLPGKVTFVFQENALFPWRTVLENVKLGMAFQGVPKAEREGPRARSA